MPAPEDSLKTMIRHSGYSMREVADYVGRPYGTLACWMNGFSPLPAEIRSRIELLIRNQETTAGIMTAESVCIEHVA